MVNILVIAASLVIFLTESSYCEPGKPQSGLFQRQFAARNDATLRHNLQNKPFKMRNPMRRSFPHANYINQSVPIVKLANQSNEWSSNSSSDQEIRKGRKQPHNIGPNFPKLDKQNTGNNNFIPSNAQTKKQEGKGMLTKGIQKSLDNPESVPVAHATGSKRVAPVVAGALTKIAGNSQVQEAVVEKGIEVAGKLIDKQLEIIDQAKEKAADFLKTGIKVDITPDKGWETEDMFVPPGYHVSAEIDESGSAKASDDNEKPYTYPAGIGSVMMNGCWGSDYKQGDPCFNAMEETEQCRNMIDGAAFIGVGFDGRGEYSPQSRKMSIIQRSCAGHSSYDDLQVPDTMNVHGIYETSAHMTVFTSRSEYQSYLQKEAGVSGSFLGFYAGVKKAWGNSKSGAAQSYLAIYDVDVDRYEIFQDEVKPQDLSRSFLREFVRLPMSYFAPGAPMKFQDFILRWGTHYIKSARFGGQLEVQKTQLASMTASKDAFSMESETEFNSLFWSAGARSSTQSGSSSKSQHNYMSTSLIAQGGDQKIASLISDMYSPTFKTEFVEWLSSIPNYPKAFKFLMSPITDLVNFRASDLFPDETVDWGCELNQDKLVQEKGSEKSYYLVGEQKVYCEFGSRLDMEYSLDRKRVSLKRAIEVYMEEGTMSISDVSLPEGDAGCQSKSPEYQSQVTNPSWKEMTTGHKRFHVMFDMMEDLKGAIHGGIDIPKSMSRVVQFSQGKWYTTNRNGEFHLYDGFRNGGSSETGNKKISIFGLVLKYEESEGSLVLEAADFAESQKYFPELSELLKGRQLARVEWPAADSFSEGTEGEVGHLPCNVQWSNGLRFDPSDRDGKCLHFTASTKGALYVIFSAVPSNKDSWYYVEMTRLGVGIYKSQRLKVSTVNTNAVALGDAILYQSYFVCVTESPTSTVIEYGKSQGTTDNGDVYLTLIDNDQPLHVRFYSFGNGEEATQIVDSHVTSRKLTTTNCKGDTYKDNDIPNCVQRCNEACAPLAGCKSRSQGDPKATECNECRFAKDQSDVCLVKCPAGQKPNKKKYCMESFDLKFKAEATSQDSDINGFQTVNDFTICLWMNFQDFHDPTSTRRTVLNFKNKDAPRTLFEIIAHHEGSEIHVLFRMSSDSGGASGRYVKFAKDTKWHLFCATRESSTGVTKVFSDGVDPVPYYSSIMEPGKKILAEGSMHLGSFGEFNYPGKISNLNMWNRRLTHDEIANLAKSCGDSAGDLKDWYDIKQELTLSKYTVVTPSGCKANLA